MKNRREEMQKRLQILHSRDKVAANSTTYIFENHKNHDFSLPKKSLCGKTMIGPRQRFKGDEYFITFVKTGDIRIVETLAPVNVDNTVQASVSEKVVEPVQVVCESSKGDSMEKLILDQPDKVTFDGKQEHLVRETPKVIKDHKVPVSKDNNEEVLLTENPMSGIDIIND
jgi:hypothetical protein